MTEEEKGGRLLRLLLEEYGSCGYFFFIGGKDNRGVRYKDSVSVRYSKVGMKHKLRFKFHFFFFS